MLCLNKYPERLLLHYTTIDRENVLGFPPRQRSFGGVLHFEVESGSPVPGSNAGGILLNGNPVVKARFITSGVMFCIMAKHVNKHPPFRLFCRYFQPFLLPDSLYALPIDLPAFTPKHRRDSPVTIPSILASQADDVGHQRPFIGQYLGDVPLSTSGLAESPANASLRDPVRFTRFPDRFSPLFRA